MPPPPLFGGRGVPSYAMSPKPRPTSVPSGTLIHAAVWLQQTWAENWAGGCAPLGMGRSPSNTMWQGPRPTSIPSAILIHVAVWPQQTWAEKWGARVPLFKEELGPHVTQCGPDQGLPSPPSGTLIHAAVWPQYVGQNWGCCAPLVGSRGVPI